MKLVARVAAVWGVRLGRDGDRLGAAILDEVGGVELLRFDANGGLLGERSCHDREATASLNTPSACAAQ